MYCGHFGLTLTPFSNTPDPRFFFNTPDHEEALASLVYVAQERKGFALLTGEVGTGKTLVSRMLLSRLPAGTRTAVITHAMVTGLELFGAICKELQIPHDPEASLQALIERLEEYLLEQYARNRLVVVVLDESQNLPAEVFEQIRLLGNLESEDAKLLQLIMLGHPEVHQALNRPELRQIRQRIFRTYHLHALSREQTAAYVQHRLDVAGAKGRRLFTDEALEAVFEHSSGLPRLINQICDNALLAAYGQNARTVSATLVHETVDAIPGCHENVAETRPAAAVAAAAPAAQSTAAAAAPVGNGAGPVSYEGLRLRLADIETFVQSLSARQQSSDQQLDDVVRRTRSAADDRSAAETFLDQARTLHDQAARALAEAQSFANRGRLQFATLMESVRRDTDDLRQQIADALLGTQQELDRVRKASTDVLGGLGDVQPKLERRITALIERQQAETNTIRTEIAELARSVERQIVEATARQEAMSTSLAGELVRVPQVIEHLRRETEDRTRAAEQRVATMMEDACARVERVQMELTQSVEAARTDVQNAKAALCDLRHDVERESDALRAAHHELAGRTQAVLTEVRQQTEAIMLDVRSQLDRTVNETELKTRGATAQCDRLVQTLDATLGDARVRGRKIGRRVEGTLKQVEQQIEQMRAALDAQLGDATARTEANASLARESAADLEGRVEAARQRISGDLDKSIAGSHHAASMIQNRITHTLKEAGEELQRAETSRETLRRDLAEIVLTARRNIQSAQSELDQVHASHASRLAEAQASIQSDLANIACEAQETIERAQLEGRSASEAVRSASAQIRQALAELEKRVSESTRGIESQVDAKLQTARDTMAQLEQIIADAATRKHDIQTVLDRELTQARRALDDLTNETGELTSGAERECEELASRTNSAIETFRTEAAAIEERLKSELVVAGERLHDVVGRASQQAEQIKADAETTHVQLVERTLVAQKGAADTIARAEAAIDAMGETTRAAQAGVQASIQDMTTRAAGVHDELSSLRDAVVRDAESGQSALRQILDHATLQIDAHREAVRAESEKAQSRMDTVAEQVERAADRVRQQASQLLADVQSGTQQLREHAAGLLEQANAGAERLSEQASTLLSQAQTTAEKFREQASELLRRAEASAQDIRRQVQSLRDDIQRDASTLHAEAEQTRTETRTTHTRTDALLSRADEIQQRTQKLLTMPQEILSEANTRAESLQKMAKTLQSVTARLNQLEQQAGRRADQLTGASAAADQKLSELSVQSARIEQLVEIVRQLHDAMEKRTDQLRERLSVAERIARDMPDQIGQLRTVLETSAAPVSRGAPAPSRSRTPAVLKARPPAPQPAQPVTMHDQALRTAGPAKAEPLTSKVIPDKKTGPTLGELVQKNARLNAWLRDVLADAEKPAESTSSSSESAAAKGS